MSGELVIRSYAVYGKDGHRQRETFNPSRRVVTDNGCTIHVANFDRTGQHDFSVVTILGDSEELVNSALSALLSDGIFKSLVGQVKEIEVW